MNTHLTRRRFLEAGGRVVALAALAPAVIGAGNDPAPAPKKRNIKKGIMYATVGVKGSVLDKFKAVKEAGFDGIEPMSHMDQEEVVKALEATGLKAGSVCC